MIGKIILAILAIVVLIGGAAAGMFLLQKRQIEPEAAVPSGSATLAINPSSASNLQAGTPFTVAVVFNSTGVAVSGVSARLEYSYTGTKPLIEPTQITENNELITTYKWRYPTKNISCDAGTCTIEIVALQTGVGGYSSTTNTQLATITFNVNAAGTTSLVFDPVNTKITSSGTGQDILGLPSITQPWTYTTTGGAPNPTPTTPASTPTPSPTGVDDDNESAVPTSTPIPLPTQTQTLPTAGTAANTYLLLSLGLLILLIGGAFGLIASKS